MHVLWISEQARFSGGCERYIFDTASHLAARGNRNSLLYDPGFPADTEFLGAFSSAFPIANLDMQIPAIGPDVMYLHRLDERKVLGPVLQQSQPAFRFHHDYRLFCLREHKYTAIKHRTCDQPLGLGCYSCLGFVVRSDRWPHVRLRRLGEVKARQALDRQLSGWVVGSSHMAHHLMAHGYDPPKVHSIPLFASPPETPPPSAREQDLLLFVGALNRGKGLDVLLDAMARLSSKARLVVIGTGNQAKSYQAKSRNLGLEPRVTFAGKLPMEEIDPYYRKAGCLVVPSRSPETFGLVGPEAMRHGTPVVASRVGGIGEWLSDGENGYAVEPGSPELLAGALDRLLENPTLALEMGARGLRIYQERFRPERHIDSLLGLFASHLGSKAA